MIPVYSEEEHYRVQAIDFVGAAIIKKCAASVHLEDSEDEFFWKALLKKYSGDKEFNFLYYSQSLGGNKTSGVNQCLKYKPYLSKQFFICIDSDYRYLLQEQDIFSNPFVFQTYTYSFENHLCYSKELSKVCEDATTLENSIFDFEKFILSYSQHVYEAFIWHLYFVKHDESKFSKSEFIELINLKEFAVTDDNGRVVIGVLNQRCELVIDKLKEENPTVNIEEEKIHYESLGIKPENAYLFIRGHNIYDLICKFGKKVCDEILSREKEVLNGDKQAIAELYKKNKSFEKCLFKHIMFEEYAEIQRLGLEIQTFFE